MKYALCSRARYLVGRFDKGEDFIEALEKLCAKKRIRAGFFQAVGVLSSVELQEFDPETRDYRSVFQARQPFEILSLSGTISTFKSSAPSSTAPGPFVQASTSLSYNTHGQLNVIGGRLLRAKVLMCEINITIFDDVKMEREFDSATKMMLWNPVSKTPDPNDFAASPPIAENTAVGDSRAEPWHAAPPVSEPKILRRGSTPETVISEEVEAPKKSKPKIVSKAVPKSKPKSKPKATPSAPSNSEPRAFLRPAPTVTVRPASTTAWSRAAATIDAESHISESDAPPADPILEEFDDEEITEDFDEILNEGDILIHPQFGDCQVMMILNEDSVQILQPGKKSSQKQKIKLAGIFKMTMERREGKVNVYKLERLPRNARRR